MLATTLPTECPPVTAMLMPDREDSQVSLSEIVSALSFALDLVEDAKPGHAIRSCLLGMRIADVLGLSGVEQSDLYYALLLKDVGCSSNSRLICEMVGGDDRTIKREAKLEDWTRASFSAVQLMWRNGRGGTVTERMGRLVRMAMHHDRSNAQLIGMRCERGAQIVRKIGLNSATAEGIRSLDEHWDGSGHPERLRGEEIPILARIMNIAQHLDLFATERGQDAAMAVLAERSGRWFDPKLVRAAQLLSRQSKLWIAYGSGLERSIVRDSEPGRALRADDSQVDRIAEAFADIVDAKSSFTYQHSLGVTDAAMRIARGLGLAEARLKVVYRAALLHDLGKLRVPNSVLDKSAKLDDGEWKILKEHPGLTRQILERIGAFGEIAAIAGNHHEKLDGTGYPHGLRAEELSLEDRLLTVADIYGALREDRPYRAGLSREKITSIMTSDIPHRLDGDCFEVLMSSLDADADFERDADA